MQQRHRSPSTSSDEIIGGNDTVFMGVSADTVAFLPSILQGTGGPPLSSEDATSMIPSPNELGASHLPTSFPPSPEAAPAARREGSKDETHAEAMIAHHEVSPACDVEMSSKPPLVASSFVRKNSSAQLASGSSTFSENGNFPKSVGEVLVMRRVKSSSDINVDSGRILPQTALGETKHLVTSDEALALSKGRKKGKHLRALVDAQGRPVVSPPQPALREAPALVPPLHRLPNSAAAAETGATQPQGTVHQHQRVSAIPQQRVFAGTIHRDATAPLSRNHSSGSASFDNMIDAVDESGCRSAQRSLPNSPVAPRPPAAAQTTVPLPHAADSDAMYSEIHGSGQLHPHHRKVVSAFAHPHGLSGALSMPDLGTLDDHSLARHRAQSHSHANNPVRSPHSSPLMDQHNHVSPTVSRKEALRRLPAVDDSDLFAQRHSSPASQVSHRLSLHQDAAMRRQRSSRSQQPPPTSVGEIRQSGGGLRGGPSHYSPQDVAVDEDDFAEKQRRNAAVSSAIHTIPWLQRRVEHFAHDNDSCAMCVAPRFWERIDWTLRATLFAVLPATIVALDPSTTTYFPLPGNVASFAFFITAPTFGGGLRELVTVIKGSIVSLALFCIVIAIQPQNQGFVVALYFSQILLVAFLAESIKKTSAWCISIFMLQYYSDAPNTGYPFVRDFFMSVLIGVAFGLSAFLLPRINWAQSQAHNTCYAYGSAVSIALQGVAQSFWAKSALEREYCLIRLRQLMAVTESLQSTLSSKLADVDYEPHTGLTIARMQRRASLLEDVTRIVACLQHIVENVASNPDITETPLFRPFGDRLEVPLGVLASAMDSTLLKICDFKHPILVSDIEAFRKIRDDFQVELSQIRQDLILSNPNYRTDESDVFLGAFMFCMDELGEVIAKFSEPTDAPSRLKEWILTPWSDLWSVVDTVRVFTKRLVHDGSLIRRAKEAIKLALSMTIPFLIQVFLLKPEDSAPVAGPSIIAWVYQKTGAESFHYASNRVLGTVVGSLTSLIAAQIADGRLYLLYIFLGILALLGNFVQTSATYTQAGNALVFSVISVLSQYNNSSAAMTRIQQNVFAILTYFAIAWVLWPVRAIEKLTLELDSALRSYRESTCTLLNNMDGTADEARQVTEEAEQHWRDSVKHASRQATLIPAAVKEPTLIGVPFPEQPWLRIVRCQKSLNALSWMMRYAFQSFESGQTEGMECHSLHWVVVHRLAPRVREVSELIFAACDLYLLSLSHAEMVPITHLVRLRLAMVEEYRNIIDSYVNTLILKLAQGGRESQPKDGASDSDADAVSKGRECKNSGSSAASSSIVVNISRTLLDVADPNFLSDIDSPRSAGESNASPRGVRGSCAEPESAQCSFVLTNRDVHSLEAFLFGIRGTVAEIGEFQKALLDVQHAVEVNNKLSA